MGWYMLYTFPSDYSDGLPVWYEVRDNGCLLCVNTGINTGDGYMFSDGNWSTGIADGDRGLSSEPQILYSDLDVYCLSNGKYSMVYDGYYDYNIGGTGGGSVDEDMSIGERIISTLLSIPISILEGLSNLFKTLFVPSFNPMTEFLNLLQEKIPIAMQLYSIIHNFVSELGNYDYDNYVPSIMLSFNGAFGLYDSYNLLDVSWYLPYRNIVNAIATGFIYLYFVFSTYKNLHKVIRGI